MAEGPQEGAARPLRIPSWHRPGPQQGVRHHGRRTANAAVDQDRWVLAILAVPASSILGLLIPMFTIGPTIVFMMWGANFWGSLFFTLSTILLVYMALDSRFDRVQSAFLMAFGTTFVYLMSFSLTFSSLLTFSDFWDLDPTMSQDHVLNVFAQGWPGIVGSSLLVWTVRFRKFWGRTGIQRNR